MTTWSATGGLSGRLKAALACGKWRVMSGWTKAQFGTSCGATNSAQVCRVRNVLFTLPFLLEESCSNIMPYAVPWSLEAKRRTKGCGTSERSERHPLVDVDWSS